MKRILVVGGAGFIGSHLCDRLIKSNKDDEIYVLDNLSTGSVCNIEDLYNQHRFRFVNVDAAKFNVWKDVRAATGIEKPDEIYYLASIASPRIYLRQPMETIRANISGLMNFLDIANRFRSKLLYTSTSEVYGDPKEMPQSEHYNGNVNPNCDRAVYDETKRVGETLVSTYARHFGVTTRIVRIFNTYGPRMSRHDGRVIPAFIEQASSNQNITIFGDGTQTRSFCYVDDTVDALVRVMNSNHSGPFNIGNPQEYFTIMDLATMIKELIPESKSEVIFTDFLSENDPMLRRPDITKIQEAVGWKPRTSIKKGLRKTIEALQNQVQ